MLAVPARRLLINTTTWLLKSRPCPSLAPPRMLIDVWAGVHVLKKATPRSLRNSVTVVAADCSISSRSNVCMVTGTSLTRSSSSVAVTTTSSKRRCGSAGSSGSAAPPCCAAAGTAATHAHTSSSALSLRCIQRVGNPFTGMRHLRRGLARRQLRTSPETLRARPPRLRVMMVMSHAGRLRIRNGKSRQCRPMTAQRMTIAWVS